MVSQRTSKVLIISSKNLAFVSHHTTQIKAKQAFCHNTNPLLKFPNPLYAMVIMSQIFLGETQSNLVNPNNLCHNPLVKEQ